MNSKPVSANGFTEELFGKDMDGPYKAEDTNKHVSDHAKTIQGFTDRFWIGINDVIEEGSFKYNSDQSIILWENWRVSGGQPNNINNQDCVAVNSNGEWDDDACSQLQSFVCEKGTTFMQTVFSQNVEQKQSPGFLFFQLPWVPNLHFI